MRGVSLMISKQRKSKQRTTARTHSDKIDPGIAFGSWRAGLVRVFAVDYRSLALFRMALALALAYDLFTQFPAFVEFHLHSDIRHHQALARYYEGVWNWSLFWWSNWPAYHQLLLVAAVVTCVCLLIGWQTRVSSFVGWILIASLNDDAPPLTSGGDGLLVLLLFWSIFLPLSQRWSIDARRLPRPPEPTYTSIATAGVMLQMAMVYFFSGISKLTPSWLDGTALELVLAHPAITRPLGKFASEAGWLLWAFTWLTLAGELILPWLLLSPWKSTKLRSVSLLLLLGMHVAIELTMNVLIFSIVSMAGLMCFVPSQWWERLPLNRLAIACDRWLPDSASSHSVAQQTRHERHRAAKFAPGLQIRNVALAAVIVYCLAYNLIESLAPAGSSHRIPGWQQTGVALKLTQRWNMFFDPRNQAFDMALIGEKADRTFVDLLRPRTAVFDRKQAPIVPGEFPYERMLYFFLALPNRDFIPFREGYVQHALQQWNAAAARQDQLTTLYLTYYPKPPHEMANVRSLDMWEARP